MSLEWARATTSAFSSRARNLTTTSSFRRASSALAAGRRTVRSSGSKYSPLRSALNCTFGPR